MQLKSLIKGGSQAWIALIYSSVIMSYEDVEQHLSFPSASLSLLTPLNAALRPFQEGDVPITFRQLIARFLKGSGIPCPGKFERARAHFNSIALGLDKINNPGFRSHLLVWAITGIPSIDLTSSESIKASAHLDSTHTLISNQHFRLSFVQMTIANTPLCHLSVKH